MKKQLNQVGRQNNSKRKERDNETIVRVAVVSSAAQLAVSHVRGKMRTGVHKHVGAQARLRRTSRCSPLRCAASSAVVTHTQGI